MTFSEENYLKAVYHLEKQFEKGVSTNALSEEMNTKASSATDMVKRLAEKDCLSYRPYQGVTLTEHGRGHALNIIRKHRLWEYFLVKKLKFNWDEVHEMAEQLEHIQSDKLTNKLEEFLGYPKVDPHGDLIPNREGNLPPSKKILLAKCKPDNKGVLVGVRDSSKAFLQYLDKRQIALGDAVEIMDKEEFDDSMLVKINGESRNISKKIAVNIYVTLHSN